MVRDTTKSMIRFTWAMSVLGMQQVANTIALDREKSTEDVDIATHAIASKLGQLPLSVFLLGDSVQREVTRIAFSLLEESNWNPNSKAVRALIEQTEETLRNLNPLQAGALTMQELQNKITVFRLVLQIPDRLTLPDNSPYPDLAEVIKKAYDMDDYSTLWAVEGIGHWYGDTFYQQGKTPNGILQGEKLNGLPEESYTMLNAGIGMAIAQHWMKEVNHFSDLGNVREVLRQITSLCRNNATPGYEGAALESLGLITTNGQFYDETRPDEMVQIVGKELLEIGDQDAFEYFWRGVGRAHYFLPIHFLPGYGSIWHAINMIWLATDHNLTARHNAIAGLAWGATMVNIRNPEILANVLKYHGADLSKDNAFSNGVTSGILMRKDTTPDSTFITSFYEHESDSSDANLVKTWNNLMRYPSEQALATGGHYQELKNSHRLGELFRYNPSFPAV